MCVAFSQRSKSFLDTHQWLCLLGHPLQLFLELQHRHWRGDVSCPRCQWQRRRSISRFVLPLKSGRYSPVVSLSAQCRCQLNGINAFLLAANCRCFSNCTCRCAVSTGMCQNAILFVQRMCIPSPCVRINGFSPFFIPLEIGWCLGVRGPPPLGIHACWHFSAADHANRSLCTSMRLANIRSNTQCSSSRWRIIDDLPDSQH